MGQRVTKPNNATEIQNRDGRAKREVPPWLTWPSAAGQAAEPTRQTNEWLKSIQNTLNFHQFSGCEFDNTFAPFEFIPRPFKKWAVNVHATFQWK